MWAELASTPIAAASAAVRRAKAHLALLQAEQISASASLLVHYQRERDVSLRVSLERSRAALQRACIA